MRLIDFAPARCAAAGLALFVVANAASAETLEVPRGQALSLKLDTEINTVAVGDVEIAEARVAFDDTIVIVGKQSGITNVIAYGNTGEEIYLASVRVLEDLSRRPVTIIAGMTRRLLLCDPDRCTEEKQPDRVVMYDTTITEEGSARQRTTQETEIERN